MAISIRPFVSADYSRVGAFFPGGNLEAQLRYADKNRDPKCKYKQFVAQDNGQIVAFAWDEQQTEMYDPQEFMIQPVIVRPKYGNLNTVEQLYEYVLNDLGKYKPVSVRVLIAKEYPFSNELNDFLKGKGFQEDKGLSLLAMRLDLSAFNFQPFAGYEDKVREQGIVIKTLNDLRVDQTWDRKLYELYYELRQGLPHHTTKAPFDYFMKERVKKQAIVPEAYFVAVHDDEYVGMSYTEASSQDDLYIKFTGVKVPYQRQDIALTLKLKVLLMLSRTSTKLLQQRIMLAISL